MYIIMFVHIRSPLYESLCTFPYAYFIVSFILVLKTANSYFLPVPSANHTSMLSNSSPVHSVLSCGIYLVHLVHCYDGSEPVLVINHIVYLGHPLFLRGGADKSLA